MTQTPASVPIAPPTSPGRVVVTRPIVWPRLLAVLGWIVAVPSALMAAAATIYPEISGALSTHLGEDGHDDLAGTLSRYRPVDIAVELLTLAAAVWLCVIARALWREGPRAGRTLVRWCLVKLVLVAINLGLLFAQSAAYFGAQTRTDPGDARIGTLIMVGWSAVLSVPFALCTLLWLLLPRVRRGWSVSN